MEITGAGDVQETDSQGVLLEEAGEDVGCPAAQLEKETFIAQAEASRIILSRKEPSRNYPIRSGSYIFTFPTHEATQDQVRTCDFSPSKRQCTMIP